MHEDNNQAESLENKDKKLEYFRERMEQFKDIKTVAEAKELASKIMPTVLERTVFYIGKTKCAILNYDDLFRICMQNDKEFICYNIVKKY